MKRSPLKRRSKKRSNEDQEYYALVRQFLKAHPICFMPGCGRPSRDPHHRVRPKCVRYLDTSTWMALCRFCHDYIEAHGSWSRAHGLIVDYPSVLLGGVDQWEVPAIKPCQLPQ